MRIRVSTPDSHNVDLYNKFIAFSDADDEGFFV